MSKKLTLKEKVNNLPSTSGCYLMKNGKGVVIYVGKAIALKKRVQSYFRGKKTHSKTDLLVSDIEDIDIIETVSEAGALILEASLVKQYNPKYNIDLKDDKSYPFVEVTGETFPRIGVSRPKVKNKTSVYYGPYVQVTLLREALAILRKIFHFRTCDPFPVKECLDYHIGLCEGPCIKEITKKEYDKNIRNVRLILEGKKDQLYKNLRVEMEALSKAQKFEEAAKRRDQLRAIGALYSGTQDVNYYKEAEQLQRALNLERLPQRIETFDISNIMGNQSVGSMVSFLDGKADKRNYRRFKIKEVKGIDDFKMIAEVVRRRYQRLKKEGLPYPDLIVVDGGKGQLSAALQQLVMIDVQIPICSLAKREEEIYLPRRRNPLKLAKDSLGLQLLQRTRDEAHRFAVAYHRNLRAKNLFKKA